MPPATRQGVLQQVDPGPHAVVGYCGGQVVTREVKLAPGDRLSVALRFHGTAKWQDDDEDMGSATPTESRHLPVAGQELPPTNPNCDSPFATPLTNPCVPRARFEPLSHRDSILEIENPYPGRQRTTRGWLPSSASVEQARFRVDG